MNPLGKILKPQSLKPFGFSVLSRENQELIHPLCVCRWATARPTDPLSTQINHSSFETNPQCAFLFWSLVSDKIFLLYYVKN